MLGLDMLDVAIGVVFVFLLLSLICSALNEMIEALMKQRAYSLEKGIREMLSGMTNWKSTNTEANTPPLDLKSPDLVTELYKHPLISGLYNGTYEFAMKYRARLWPMLPSYIPSRNFALALTDLLAPQEASGSKDHLMIDFRRTIAGHKDENIKKALLPLVDSAALQTEDVIKNIEQWFDSTMERISGQYKRRVQYFTFALGLLAAIVLNADTIAITNSLIHDPALRSAIVSTAQEYAKTPTASMPQANTLPGNSAAPASGNHDDDLKNTLEVAKACKNFGSEECKKVCNDENAGLPGCKLAQNFTELKSLGLPLGWENAPAECSIFYPGKCFIGGFQGNSFWLKLLGWLITGIAISLGAPFWFDLLNKFMTLRSTLKPDEKKNA
jgi:hypothetical protein